MFTYWPLYCLSHSLSVFFPSGEWDVIVLIEELKDKVQKISVSKMLDLHLVIPIPLTICCISRITALNISLPCDNFFIFLLEMVSVFKNVRFGSKGLISYTWQWFGLFTDPCLLYFFFSSLLTDHLLETQAAYWAYYQKWALQVHWLFNSFVMIGFSFSYVQYHFGSCKWLKISLLLQYYKKYLNFMMLPLFFIGYCIPQVT